MKRPPRLSRIYFASAVITVIALFLPRDVAYAQSSSDLPLADLHFHADKALAPETVLGIMDRAGVKWAGNGAKGADTVWRFLTFAGQGAIGVRIQSQGESAWTLKSPELNRYLEVLEEGLRAGRFRGIGELFVNNEHSHAADFQPTSYPADSPLMRRLLSLAAAYHVPLSIHMEAERGSVEELERLLPVDRNGQVIWAHCGFWIEADQLQKLMDRHSNLLCELSHRDDRTHARGFRTAPITERGRRLKPDWKALLENRSERFLIGTDTDNLSQYPAVTGFYREVLAQLAPEAAARFANGNATRLFRLRP